MSIVDEARPHAKKRAEDAFLASLAKTVVGSYERERWAADPDAWVRERLDGHLWSIQKQILESIRDNRLTAVQSCHGIGKSRGTATGACWWIDTHEIGKAKVVTTAPTFPQVHGVMWAEINAIHADMAAAGKPLPGRINEIEWKHDKQLIAFGRKPADNNKHGLQGIHARDGVLIIIDEACGVPEQLWIAATAIASNDASRIVACGNPDDPGSFFARICKPGSGWNVIKVGVADTPNWTGEEVPADIQKALVNQEYVDDLVRTHGEDSPIYISKVLGRFPSDSKDGVVSYAALTSCGRLPGQPRIPEELLPVELGVDIGGGHGGDETVIQERRGCMVGKQWRSRNWDTVETTRRVLMAIKETGATAVKLDRIGIGKGVVDNLLSHQRQGEHDAQIVGVNVAMPAREAGRFYNSRSEMWWLVGHELSLTNGWDFTGLKKIDDHVRPDWDELRTQLCAPKWEADATGRIKVEPKEETVKRLGHSPDVADALLLAFYSPTGASTFFEALVAQQRPHQELPAMAKAIAAEQARGAA